MSEIYESIKACARADVTCIRSAHAVTIVCEWPQRYRPYPKFSNCRHIQIILRLYSSPSEILVGFDIDACAVGFNGSDVFACPRAFISLVTQSVTVDMSRRSPSYEMRLAKYATRGFEIFVPDLRREDIDPTVHNPQPHLADIRFSIDRPSVSKVWHVFLFSRFSKPMSLGTSTLISVASNVFVHLLPKS